MRKMVFLFLIIAIFLSGCVGSSDEKIAEEIAKCKADAVSGENCLIQAAAKLKDEKICANITIEPLKDGCIVAVAVAKQDMALCDSISNQTKTMSSQDKMCRAMISLDTKYCDEITTYLGFGEDQMRGACYAFIVQKKSDPSICQRAKTENVKNICLLAAANATRDIGYCDRLPENSYKGECYGYFVEDKKSPELCEKLKANISKGYCYRAAINVLGGAKNASWCTILPGQYEAEKCLENYTISTGNWRECEKFNIASMRWECFAGSAIIAKDPEGCEKSEGDFRDKCLISVAQAKQDISICSRISENYRKYVPASDMGYCAAFFK